MALFKKKISDDPKELWEDFFMVVMKNDWKKALELIEGLKQLEPDNAQVHMKMGDILQRTGDSEGAVPAYHQAASCLITSEDYSKALAIYKIILRLNPDDEEAVARSHELMGGTPVAPQPQEGMTYEEATGEGGEYYEEQAEGEGASQPEGEPQQEEGTYEEGAYEEPPAEAGSYTEEPEGYSQPEETYSEEAAHPPTVSPDDEAGADDAIAGLYDAEEEAPASEPEPPEPQEEPEPREEPQAAAPQAGSKGSVALLEAFKRHPMFKVLSDEDIDIMIKKARHSVLKDGESVINEDEPGDSMFIIKKGQARVTSTMFDKTYELATLGGGNFFGEVGFLTGMPRTATVTSKGGLSVMEINKPLMQELIERNPKVLQKLVELSHSRTQKKMKKMND